MRGGEAFVPVPNRGMITVSIMLANIMQGIDNTILNVALPHIQGSLSASQDQIAWALTSYIVCAAIMMPLTGWLAGRFGIKYIFLASVICFTLASALCGMAANLGELVLFRALQGLAGAGLIPLSQSTLLQINPPERHGSAMAVFGIGTILGPIMGPALGGWLTEDYSWRWVFYINLPVGVLCTLGILVFIRQTRNVHREAFDFRRVLHAEPRGRRVAADARPRRVEGLVSFERNLDRGGGFRARLLPVHGAHGDHRRALVSQPRPLEKPEFRRRHPIDVQRRADHDRHIGADANDARQHLMNYPAMTTGLVSTPRGFGVMIAMLLVARLVGRVDNRLIILVGFLLTAVSMWQMSQFSLQMGMAPVITSGLLQGFGLGCTFVPLNIIALSTLPRHIMTQGTAIRSLMRNLGGSIGISILVATLAENTQAVHARLVEPLRPDNPLLHGGQYLGTPYNLVSPGGIAALNQEVTRQAAMVAYIDDFKLMMLIALLSLPLLLLLREPRSSTPAATPAPAGADD